MNRSGGLQAPARLISFSGFYVRTFSWQDIEGNFNLISLKN